MQFLKNVRSPRRTLLHPSSSYPETSAHVYQTTRRHIPEYDLHNPQLPARATHLHLLLPWNSSPYYLLSTLPFYRNFLDLPMSLCLIETVHLAIWHLLRIYVTVSVTVYSERNYHYSLQWVARIAFPDENVTPSLPRTSLWIWYISPSTKMSQNWYP